MTRRTRRICRTCHTVPAVVAATSLRFRHPTGIALMGPFWRRSTAFSQIRLGWDWRGRTVIVRYVPGTIGRGHVVQLYPLRIGTVDAYALVADSEPSLRV